MVKQIASDAEFTAELDKTMGKLLVADFFATWCGPCRNIAPFYEQLGTKYPTVNFIKVDVDICQATAASQNVTAMPTFLFFLNRKKVEAIKGADPAQLEEKIRHWATVVSASAEGGEAETAGLPAGQLDLTPFLESWDSSELSDIGNFIMGVPMCSLVTLCEPQLIIRLVFNHPVKVHSVKFKSDAKCGPKTVKISINLPEIHDYDEATADEPTQLLELTEKQVVDGEIVNLRYVKFQNVQNIQFFVQDNLGGADTTKISTLKMYGTPMPLMQQQNESNNLAERTVHTTNGTFMRDYNSLKLKVVELEEKLSRLEKTLSQLL